MNFQPRFYHFWLLSLILVSVTCVVAGCYYDSSDDAIINLLIQGKAGGVSITNFPRFYFFISDALKYLYDWMPSIPWQALLFYNMLILAFAELTSVIYRHLGISPKKVIFLTLLVYYFIGIESVMFFNMNRFSIILSGVGMLSLYLSYTKREGRWEILRGIVLIILGMLIRPNGGLMALIIVIPGCFLYGICRRIKLTSNVQGVFLLLAFFLAFYSALNYTKTVDDQAFKYRNYLKSNIIDFRIVDQSGLNQRENLYLESVYNGYIADTAITNEFLEKITSDRRITLSGFSEDKWLKSLKSLGWKMVWDYAAVSCLILALFILGWRSHSYFYWVVYYNAFVLVVLFCVSYFLKLPDKILGPTLLLVLAMNVVMIFRYDSFLISKGIRKMVLFSLGLLAVAYSVKLVHRITHTGEIQKHKGIAIQELNSNFNDRIIVTSNYYNILLYSNPFWKFDLKYGQRFLNISGWITILPDYHKVYKNISGESDWLGIFRLASTKKANVTFVFYTPNAALFLESYLKEIHDMSFKFQRIYPEKKCTEGLLYYVPEFIE